MAKKPVVSPTDVEGLGSVLSTVSGPSSAPPPNCPASAGGAKVAMARKVSAGARLAAAMPSNPNKPLEYGDAARSAVLGVNVAADDRLAGASTVSELQASPKVGGGETPRGINMNIMPLDKVRADSSGQRLTTNHGVPVADNQHSLKIGLRGPTAMEDFILREKLTHFDHERIPERVVHARGSGAHGYFENYASLSEHTRAAMFSTPGKRTPVFVRFSTVAGERGSADTVRDVRGFAVKFYTDEGNFDLVGNNIPVFFIQDAMKFPDLVHAVKPEPHNAIPQASSAHDTFWDFVSLMPESTHMLMWQMSDRAIPRSYRMMQGFGVHSFRLVNEAGESVFCKFHWTPKAGTHALVWDEAVKICGADPDFHRRDLWEAIEAGAYPEFELGLQIFSEAQADQFEFDILDPTKIIPEELVPVTPVGRMVLNRNPDNFFAETEQVAFCTAHLVPGLDFSNDPLLQGRIHSYLDTQLTRLGGPNFHEIPINAPIAQVHNNQRDGLHRKTINRGRVAYEPNSLAGGCPFQAGAMGFTSFPQSIAEDKVRGKPELFAEHYAQARLFYLSQTALEQAHIASAFRFELTRVQTQAVRERVISLLVNVDENLADTVAAGIGMPVPPAAPNGFSGAAPEYPLSPSLSMRARPGNGSIATRRVAILVADGVNATALRSLYSDLIGAGAVPRFVGANLGSVIAGSGLPLHVEVSLDAMPSVLWDGVVIADGAGSLADAPDLVDFLRDSYRHLKTIVAIGDASRLLELAGIRMDLADGRADPGVLLLPPSHSDLIFGPLQSALAMHRHFEREQR